MDRDEGAVERVTVDMGTGEILAVEPAGELPAPNAMDPPAGAEISGHLINELQESRPPRKRNRRKPSTGKLRMTPTARFMPIQGAVPVGKAQREQRTGNPAGLVLLK